MEIKQLDHPAAWRGDQLQSRPDWGQVLSVPELAEIDAAAGQLEQGDSISAFDFPQLTGKLSAIQDSLENQSGVTMIRGLPVEKYDVEILKKLFFAIAAKIGTPLSQSATDETIFSVRNEGFAEDDPRTRGPNTKKRLSFHTDRCDVIGFLCVQQAKSGGENQVVSSMSIYNELVATRPDLLHELMQPFYYQRHNVDLGNESPFTQQPIFSIHNGHFAANYLRVLIERAHASDDVPSMTNRQRAALDEVDRIAGDPKMHFVFSQQPGDMLFLNNWVTFHRRNEFEDHQELELRRHLLRVWLSVPNSRPLDPMFAGNYGATAAGAIRGGMNPKN